MTPVIHIISRTLTSHTDYILLLRRCIQDRELRIALQTAFCEDRLGFDTEESILSELYNEATA